MHREDATLEGLLQGWCVHAGAGHQDHALEVDVITKVHSKLHTTLGELSGVGAKLQLVPRLQDNEATSTDVALF